MNIFYLKHFSLAKMRKLVIIMKSPIKSFTPIPFWGALCNMI